MLLLHLVNIHKRGTPCSNLLWRMKTLGVYTKYWEEKNVKRARFLDGFQLEVA